MSALYLSLKKGKVFEIVKEGPFGLFENPVCLQNMKRIERKMRTVNSLIEPKNVKEGSFGLFQHPFSCKISKN